MRILSHAFAGTILICLLGNPLDAAAQQIGVKGGLNLATIKLTADDEGDQEFLERHTGFVGGVFTVLPIEGNGRVAVQTEALIGQRGARYVDDEEEVLRLTYLEIPLLARFTPRPGRPASFHVFTGPTFGVNLDARVIEEGDSEDFGDYTKRGDVAWTVGGGMDWQRLVLDVRYTHGLTDATKGEAPPLKHRVIAVMAGVRFK